MDLRRNCLPRYMHAQLHVAMYMRCCMCARALLVSGLGDKTLIRNMRSAILKRERAQSRLQKKISAKLPGSAAAVSPTVDASSATIAVEGIRTCFRK